MKKIVVLLLSVFLLLPTFHVIAEQTAEPTIEVGSVEGKAGETVEIPVRIKNNPGICNFTLDVVYDETKLQYNGATVNKNFASYITEGEYIVWWDMANSTYNGEIFTLSFTVLDTTQEGETAVSIAYNNETGGITNWNEDFVEFNIVSGSVNVIPEQVNPTIEVGSVEGEIGETVEIPVIINNNPGICNFTLDVVYDETKLLYNGATVNKAFASNIIEGEYIVWFDMADSTYNGEIFTLSFTVLDTVQGGETAVSIAYDNKTGGITNWNEDFVEFNTIPGSVNVLLGEVMYGDVDNDQLINLNDLITLAQYMADWEELEINLAASDVTKNGEIDLEDVTRLARYIAGWNIKLN